MKKIKKIFCVSFIAIVIPFSSYSQYIPLLKNNAIWHVYQVLEESGFTEKQQLTGDTVIANITYKILASDMSGSGPFILREDTIAKKVYQYLNDTEFLLYDFSLPIGGIFNYFNPQFPSWTPHLRLDSITGTIDPLFFNQATDWTTIHPLRVYYFTDTDPAVFFQILWVEGLGSLSGLLLPANAWGGGTWGDKLLCHNSTADTIDYHFVFWWETSPCMGPLLGFNNAERVTSVSVYPDPITSDEVTITGENIVQVQFFNSIAENVLNYAVAGTQSLINISYLPQGIYFLKIQFKNGQCVVKKVIRI